MLLLLLSISSERKKTATGQPAVEQKAEVPSKNKNAEHYAVEMGPVLTRN
jgi:hypothetical protein